MAQQTHAVQVSRFGVPESCRTPQTRERPTQHKANTAKLHIQGVPGGKVNILGGRSMVILSK
jgi:hypothetical protein